MSEHNGADERRGQPPSLLRLAGILALVAVLPTSACSSPGETSDSQPTQSETFEIPEQTAPPLELDGIFGEGTVGDEKLPVVELGSGVCASGGDDS